MEHKWHDPKQIFEEYHTGTTYKSALGDRGLFEQVKINERMYVGDQWKGAKTGERPLLRYNIIRRIGEYKMAMTASANVSVLYSAEGVPNTAELKEKTRARMAAIRDGGDVEGAMPKVSGLPTAERVNLAMAAMTDYFRTTAERVKFDDIKNAALRNAYISGTGVVYTYWDDRIKTGLYADAARTSPIVGDIRCEVLDITNVVFGDPTLDDVQEQPYIIIAQRKRVDELKMEARRNHRPAEEVAAIQADEHREYLAGDRTDTDDRGNQKATVLTKLYKEWDEDGQSYRILATVAVEGAVIRKPWDTKVRLYPIAKMSWEKRANCIYGDSEVTYLIPNQIAINRTVTANVQALTMNGMPIMLVNRDVVPTAVTNDPGQIIDIYGNAEEMNSAVRYVQPPAVVGQFENVINSLIGNTLTQAGANDAALGDMKPDNTSAIMAVREAATMPMQLLQNRFYSFIEDISRIWAEFWVNLYGKRSLKVEDATGEWYIPFDGQQYRDVLINARVDVGATGLWSELQSQQTLDNMLASRLITPIQYLKRLPKGSVPQLGELIRDTEEAMAAQLTAATVPPSAEGVNGASASAAPYGEVGTGEGNGTGAPSPTMEGLLSRLPPEYQQAFANMTPEQQQAVIQRMMQ